MSQPHTRGTGGDAERGVRIGLRAALLLALGTALAAGIVPTGLLLDRALARELEERARVELEMASEILADRHANTSDALMMRAKDAAGGDRLRTALLSSDAPGALAAAEAARGSFGDGSVVVDRRGDALTDAAPDVSLVEATRRGDMPVDVVVDAGSAWMISLAPVTSGEAWIGAVGIRMALDEGFAGTLAGLTRSDVVLLDGSTVIAASTKAEHAPDAARIHVASGASGTAGATPVERVSVPGREPDFLVSSGRLGSASVVFVRDFSDIFGVLPKLRRVAGVSAAAALILTLLVASILEPSIVRPARRLADAADRLSDGRFDVPLKGSYIREMDRVSKAFDSMRRALAARMAELVEANETLEERQRRLAALQGELVRRERQSATGWLVGQLAHEIRNPIAGLRNNLEVLRRRLADDPEGREFADLAIDELLRMHELAERVLDANRPGNGGAKGAGVPDAAAVARDVAALMTGGARGDGLRIEVEGSGSVGMPRDALKQVLLNLVQNADEASAEPVGVTIRIEPEEERVRVVVEDDGPGIPDEILSRIADPFFTTKDVEGGSGLGLYIADGIVRRYEGRLEIGNAPGGGARFVLDLPTFPGTAVPVADPEAEGAGAGDHGATVAATGRAGEATSGEEPT